MAYPVIILLLKLFIINPFIRLMLTNIVQRVLEYEGFVKPDCCRYSYEHRKQGCVITPQIREHVKD